MLAGLPAVPDRLDQHPFRAVADREVKPVGSAPRRRSDCPEPDCRRRRARCNTPCAPLPEITLSSCGSTPPTVALAEPSTTPCCGVSRARKRDGGRRRQRQTRLGIDRIDHVLADEVALDQVAAVVGIGDRNADVESLDGQAAEDAVGSVEHKPMSARRLAIWLPSMITRTWALLPSSAVLCVGSRRDQRRGQGHPAQLAVAIATLGLVPPVRLLVAVRSGCASPADAP